MKTEILIYTRRHCCLCEEMKQAVQRVAPRYSLTVTEVDVDASPELQEKYTNEVPVLFINGRKAFKYRATEKGLAARLARARSWRARTLGSLFRRL